MKQSDHYETPWPIFQQACNLFNVYPKLDVCATAKNTKCPRYYDKFGLDLPYDNDFWLNPPYSESKKWVRKAYIEHIKHNVNGLALLQSKTGTSYWHDYIFGTHKDGSPKAVVTFLPGRIRFNLDNKPTKFNPRFDSAIVFWPKRSY